eukprot:11826182-Prorocentrum_lima.AAC.1
MCIRDRRVGEPAAAPKRGGEKGKSCAAGSPTLCPGSRGGLVSSHVPRGVNEPPLHHQRRAGQLAEGTL